MKQKIITIGRQYGSGGHEIGERLSKLLNIPLYDKILVEMAADKLGLSSSEVNSLDEKVLEHFLDAYQAPWETSSYLADYGRPLSDQIFVAQSAIIENLAKRGPCIIVGRCADYVLRDFSSCIHLFVCASKKHRIQRVMERYGLTEKEASEKIRRTDKMRRNYYEAYTQWDWGSVESYQMMFNSGLLGMEHIVDLIRYLYEKQEDA